MKKRGTDDSGQLNQKHVEWTIHSMFCDLEAFGWIPPKVSRYEVF